MENSWYIVEDESSGLKSLATSDISEKSLECEQAFQGTSKLNEQNLSQSSEIKDLNDIDELKMNDVLSLIATTNNKKLQNIVKTSNEKSLLQSAAVSSLSPNGGNHSDLRSIY